MDDELFDSLQYAVQTATDIANTWSAYSAESKNRSDAWKMYWLEQRHNSPAYRMQLLRSAGLNPYGSFSTGGSSAGNLPVTGDLTGSALSSMSEHLGRRGETAYNRLYARIAMKQLELDEKKIDLETKRTDSMLRSSDSTNYYQTLLNFLFEQTIPDKINTSKAELDNLLESVLSRRLDNQYNLETLLSRVGEAYERWVALYDENNMYKPAAERRANADLNLRRNADSRAAASHEVELNLSKNQLFLSDAEVKQLKDFESLLADTEQLPEELRPLQKFLHLLIKKYFKD